MKKILSMLLVLTMSLSLSVPAFAADSNQVYDELEGMASSKVIFQVVNTCDHEGCYWKDNGDGTHDEICTGCGEVLIDDEAHADLDGDGVCDRCDADLDTPGPGCDHDGSYWKDNGDGTHDKICDGCGDVLVNDEEHVDDNEDKTCDKCGALIAGSGPVLIATVPLKLPILMDMKGRITVSTNAVVQNHVEDRAIAVTDITVAVGDGWMLGSMGDDFNEFEPGSKILAMSFRSDTYDETGVFVLTAGDWNIGASDALKLNMAAKVPVQTKIVGESEIADVEFVLNWAVDANALTSDVNTGAGDQDDINAGVEVGPVEPEVVSFAVIPENRAMVGYTGVEGEVLEIPAEFDGEDGVHYVVTEIGQNAFADCTNLSSVVIPNGVKTIGRNAFIRCSNLSSIVIPDSVLSIESYAFANCSALPSVVIPNSVTSVGQYMFANCTSLSSVTISDSVTLLSRGMFYGCSALLGITIPDSVETIDNDVFRWSGLLSIVIPDSVTSLGAGVFYENLSLSSVKLSKNLKRLDATFCGCSSLTSVVIPDGVELLGNQTFMDCTALSFVEIPDSVRAINYSVFANCTSILLLVVPNSVTTILSSAFEGVPKVVYGGSATGSPWGAAAVVKA